MKYAVREIKRVSETIILCKDKVLYLRIVKQIQKIAHCDTDDTIDRAELLTTRDSMLIWQHVDYF